MPFSGRLRTELDHKLLERQLSCLRNNVPRLHSRLVLSSSLVLSQSHAAQESFCVLCTSPSSFPCSKPSRLAYRDCASVSTESGLLSSSPLFLLLSSCSSTAPALLSSLPFLPISPSPSLLLLPFAPYLLLHVPTFAPYFGTIILPSHGHGECTRSRRLPPDVASMFETHELNGNDAFTLCAMSRIELQDVLAHEGMRAAVAQLVASGALADVRPPQRAQVLEEDLAFNSIAPPSATLSAAAEGSSSATAPPAPQPSPLHVESKRDVSESRNTGTAASSDGVAASVGTDGAVRGREGFDATAPVPARLLGDDRPRRRAGRRLPRPPPRRKQETDASLFDYYVLSEPFDDTVKPQLRDLDRVPHEYVVPLALARKRLCLWATTPLRVAFANLFNP